MSGDFVKRLSEIASDLLPGEQVEVSAHGEDYYTIAGTGKDGRKSNFPPVWLPASFSEGQIRDKLALEFRQNLEPDAEPGDLSVPNLENEGRVTGIDRHHH